MLKLAGKIFFAIFGFLACYCVVYYLVTGSSLENPLQYILNALRDMGDVNIWLQITDYWNTSFLPVWNAFLTPDNVFEAVLGAVTLIFNVLWLPLQFLVFIVGDIFSLLTSLFGFLSFGG